MLTRLAQRAPGAVGIAAQGDHMVAARLQGPHHGTADRSGCAADYNSCH
jgi:hypothetical protein